ncbi:hypothetical protein [Ottowia thiooxydans]|uniref:hypothetical protein n=1 Tax=Ottowia thiooxydans TaxID=219182 RepID=UPI0004900A44|nr:hypothetical protein [Ottowia thiooxydans]
MSVQVAHALLSLRRLVFSALTLAMLFFSIGCSDAEGAGREAAAQIENLENIGQIPRLDRGTSIAGVDVNGNGVRDDIEDVIAAQPFSDVQKKALLQAGRALQLSLITPLNDKVALDRIGALSAASVRCIGRVFDSRDSDVWLTKIEAMTANTRQRAQRYLDYNKAVSGSFTRMPDGDTCEP